MSAPQQFPQQPAPHQPGPQQPSWFRRHKIITGLLVLVVLGIGISAVNGGSATTPSTTAPATGAPTTGASSQGGSAAAPAPDAPAAAAGIGVPVRDGKFEFVVDSVESGVPSVGEQFLTESAQGEFVLVTLTVTNIGDEAQSFFTSAQKLLDASGRQFSADDVASISLDSSSAYEQINPGNSVQTTVVFDVPVGTAATEIELHDSVFSGGTTVGLA